MLSLAHCAELLGAAKPEGDDALATVRDDLYALARHVVGSCVIAKRAQRSEPKPQGRGKVLRAFDLALSKMPEDEREAVVERATILEFEGGLSRDAAERAAVSDWIAKRR